MIVMDASIIGPLTLPDEPDVPPPVHKRILAGPLMAPPHFRFEVANLLQMAMRRQRITSAQRDHALMIVDDLSVDVDPVVGGAVWSDIFRLADLHRLTVYDAAYLELAIRRSAALITLDRALIAAGHIEQIDVMDFR